MGKSYSSIFFPMSDTDPACLEEGLIPEEVQLDSAGNPTLKKYIGLQALKFTLRNILLTLPGEALSDPEFGVGIQRYIFELETINFDPLKADIEKQIQKYVVSQGYIERFKVNFRVLGDQNALHVLIQYIPTSTKKLEELIVEVTA